MPVIIASSLAFIRSAPVPIFTAASSRMVILRAIANISPFCVSSVLAMVTSSTAVSVSNAPSVLTPPSPSICSDS